MYIFFGLYFLISIVTTNFTTRLTAMAGVILMQAWLAWNFICYQIRVWRERAIIATPSKKKETKKKNKKESDKKKKEEAAAEESEEAEADEEYEKRNGSPKAVTKVKKS